MSSLASFLISRSFWKQILIAIILSGILFWVGLWITDIYTNHGEKIAVPSLRGKTIDEAETLLDEANLSFKVVDSVFNRNAKAGSVIEQFPRSGQEVKRNRVIALTIAAIAPQKVKIEAVKDLSLRQAIGQLSKKGIRVKNLKYVESNYTNLVLGMQTPNGKDLQIGDEIYKGDEVTLVVGKDGNTLFSVPNLIGASATYAKRKALEAGLNIGKITFKDKSEENRSTSLVTYQSLEAGEQVAPGSVINISLRPEKKNTDN